MKFNFQVSFTDQLIVSDIKNGLKARQVLRLWNFKVAQFDYDIKMKEA